MHFLYKRFIFDVFPPNVQTNTMEKTLVASPNESQSDIGDISVDSKNGGFGIRGRHVACATHGSEFSHRVAAFLYVLVWTGKTLRKQ